MNKARGETCLKETRAGSTKSVIDWPKRTDRHKDKIYHTKHMHQMGT